MKKHKTDQKITKIISSFENFIQSLSERLKKENPISALEFEQYNQTLKSTEEDLVSSVARDSTIELKVMILKNMLDTKEVHKVQKEELLSRLRKLYDIVEQERQYLTDWGVITAISGLETEIELLKGGGPMSKDKEGNIRTALTFLEDAINVADRAALAVKQAEQAANEAEQAANEAEQAANEAEEDARKAATRAKNEAAGSRKAATRAKNEAEDAREAAKRAKNEAEDARKAAKRAKNEAEDAREAAKRAKNEAAGSRKYKKVAEVVDAAKRAKNEAEDAREAAKRAKNEAAGARKAAKRAKRAPVVVGVQSGTDAKTDIGTLEVEKQHNNQKRSSDAQSGGTVIDQGQSNQPPMQPNPVQPPIVIPNPAPPQPAPPIQMPSYRDTVYKDSKNISQGCLVGYIIED